LCWNNGEMAVIRVDTETLLHHNFPMVPVLEFSFFANLLGLLGHTEYHFIVCMFYDYFRDVQHKRSLWQT